jgi:DNA transformation protein
MMVGKEYLELMMDKLEPLGSVRNKAMFGGYGIFYEDTMFALISDNVLYFKVDQESQHKYEDIGSRPFPHGISYWEVPPAILEDDIKLRKWANKSIVIALRLAHNKQGKKR